MKKKITFPDWTGPAAVTITRGRTKDKPRAVWEEYTQAPAEWLSSARRWKLPGFGPL